MVEYVLRRGVQVGDGVGVQRNIGEVITPAQQPVMDFTWDTSIKLNGLVGLYRASADIFFPVGLAAAKATNGDFVLQVQPVSSQLTPITQSAPTQVSVGVASGVLLAANAARRYLVIVNNAAAARVSIAFGVAAVLDSGITLQPNGGAYEMSVGAGNLNVGEIRAIASGAATTVGLQEGV